MGEPDLHNQTLAWSIVGHCFWILSCIGGIIFLLWKDEVYILRKSFCVLLATQVIIIFIYFSWYLTFNNFKSSIFFGDDSFFFCLSLLNLDIRIENLVEILIE
jgi:hypothetical protein